MEEKLLISKFRIAIQNILLWMMDDQNGQDLKFIQIHKEKWLLVIDLYKNDLQQKKLFQLQKIN